MSGSMPMPPGMASGDTSTLRAPPPAIAQALKQLRTTPLLLAVASLFLPLALCILVAVALLHSALACSALELCLCWWRYLRFLLWDRIGTLHSRHKSNHLLLSFHTPLLLALLTLRALVQRAVSQHVPHTTVAKRKAVIGVSLGYVALVYLCFGSVAAQAQADIDAAASSFPTGGGGDADSAGFTPASLFLSLYHTTLLAALLSCVSQFWVPTSDEHLRRAERELLRAHQASSGSDARTLDAQLQQHVAGHLAYTLLQGEPERDEAGSGVKDEKEGTQTNKADVDGTAVVFLHGYGGGKSVFFLNQAPLSAALPHARIYSLDLMGLGCSGPSRSMSRCRTSGDAEAYFVSALEGWRHTLGLERMVLCGHAFGGYVAACYAMRYPARVQQLVLVSPIGLPLSPPIDPETGLPLVKPSPKAAAAMAAANGGAAASTADSEEDASASPAWPSRASIARVMRWVWSLHLTLSDALHFLGPLGPPLFRLLVGRRFAQLDGARPRRRADGTVSPPGIHVGPITDYLYHLNAGACPGHVGLNLLLHPGAFAVDPLLPRLKARLASPCAFMYGAEDSWMDAQAGQEVVEAIQARAEPETKEDAAEGAAKEETTAGDSTAASATASGTAADRALPVDVECVVVPQAGNQLYIENPRAFNAHMVRIVCMAEARRKFAHKIGAAAQADIAAASATTDSASDNASATDSSPAASPAEPLPTSDSADSASAESVLRHRAATASVVE